MRLPQSENKRHATRIVIMVRANFGNAVINYEIGINRKIRKDANDDDDKSVRSVCGRAATRLDKLL